MLRNVWNAYNRVLHQSPLITQSLTTGFLLGAGDVIAQKVVEKREDMDWKRTAKFGVFGVCFVGPVLNRWFVTLERLYGSVGKITPLKKVATDQLCFAPVLQFTAIPILGAMSGDAWQEIENRIRNDYKDIMIANWRLWPFVGLVNFYFVPLNYRVPVVAFVSLFWNIYYTWKLGNKPAEVVTDAKEKPN